jgi:O-antigen/teichoic acid export membrane protein
MLRADRQQERGKIIETANVPQQDAHGPPGSGPRISHAALLVAAQASRWSLRLAFVLVVARSLGPEKFGVYALLYAVTEFLAVASGSMYADYLTREAARDAELGWGLAYQLASLRLAIAAPVALVEVGILYAMRYPRPVLIAAAWMALAVVPRCLSEAVQGVLRGICRLGGYLLIDLVLGGSLVAGGACLAFGHGGLRAAIAAEIVAAGAAGIAGLALAWKHRSARRILIWRSSLFKTSAVFNVYSLVGSFYDRFDVVLLSRLVGDYATGIYSVAYRALGMTQIVGYGVFYSLLPGLSRNARSEEGRRRLERATVLLLCAGFAVVLATLVFAGPAVRLLLGERYAESAAALRILIWAVLPRYINCALNIALIAAGRERVLVTTSLVCLAVNLIGNMAFIPLYSWRAAAVITIVTELALLVQNLYWVQKILGRVSFPWGLARIAFVFVALLGAEQVGGRLGLPLVTGTACLIIFGAYVSANCMAAEFAAVWGAESHPEG